jgi:sugar/nucleoside kinase (ribokinase family)
VSYKKMMENTLQSYQKFRLPQYVCIGHAYHDVHGIIYILGGTASYASIAATHLGMKAAVWVSCGEDFLFESKFSTQNIAFYKQKALETTIFENIYQDGSRTQYVRACADVMDFNKIPELFTLTPIVHICPIADEIDYQLLDYFQNALIGLTPKGSMRQWDSDGKVSPKAMDWAVFAQVDVVILSEEDIKGFEQFVPLMIDYAKILVITRGKNGAHVYTQNQVHFYPSFPVTEQDATGAGDVFAAAFLIKYAEKKDIAIAASYAHVAASFVVEGIGLNNLAALKMIETRYEMYQQLNSPNIE